MLTDQLDAFAPPPPARRTRRRATVGAESGARAIAPHLEGARGAVFVAIRKHGPISGAGLERLPELSHLGTTTARKRAIELRDRGLVVESIRRCAVTGKLCAHFAVVER